MFFSSNYNKQSKASSYEQYRKKEEDSAYDGSSESDGDDKPIGGKKKAKASSNLLNQMGYNFATTAMAPNTCFTETASLEVFKSKATQLVEDRKNKNNIWKDIAEEDLVTDIAASFYTQGAVRTDESLQERGPEQYLNRRLRKRRFDERTYYPMFESDSEISSDGLSDDSLEFVRSRRGKEMASVIRNTVAGGRAFSVPQSATKPKRYSIPVNTSAAEVSNQCSESLEIISGPLPETTEKSIHMDDCDMNGVIKENDSREHQSAMDVEIKNEEKKHIERKNRKADLESRFKNLDDEKFVLKMVQHLQEQRNPDIILKAVSVLGREECLRLLHKTMKIKRCGGIVIKKKTRIRTTGGTFLYLLRNDKRILPDKKEAILTDDWDQRPKQVTGHKYFDKPPKIPLDYNGLTQRIVSRSNRGAPQSRIDLEGDKFTLPSNMEVHETAKQTLPTRKEVTYDDLDFEF